MRLGCRSVKRCVLAPPNLQWWSRRLHPVAGRSRGGTGPRGWGGEAGEASAVSARSTG
jgi:hypothetical protein